MTCYWDDDFSGSLNDKWIDISSGIGSTSIVGGKLRCSVTAGLIGNGGVKSKGVFSGDFEVKVHVDLITYPTADYWAARLSFVIDGSHYFWIGALADVLAPFSLYTAYGMPGPVNYWSSRAGYTSFWLKLIRSGANVSCYYSLNDVTYNLVGSPLAVGSGDGHIYLEVANWASLPAAVADFDNFTVISGCPAEPIPEIDLPTVITNPISNITSTSGILNGNVTDAGGGTISQRGFVWSSESSMPTISDNLITVSGTIGKYSSLLTNLNKSTIYYIRATATNETGTSYGGIELLTTTNTSETHTDITTGELSETGSSSKLEENMWDKLIKIIRYYLRDPDDSIFTDEELLQYYNDVSFEIASKTGPVIRVEAHYFPPEYDCSFMWDWESDFGEGTQYQCLMINQADGWVITFPWESAYWLDVEPSQDNGYRDIHPWEMCLGSAADVIKVPLHRKFAKMLYCAFDELTLDPIDEKRLSERDAYYRTRTGLAVNYYRPDEVQNEIVIYPLPSNIWDETEIYEVLADDGGMLANESWLDLRDQGITSDVIPTDGMLVMVYQAMPDELQSWEDVPDLPPYLVKYVRHGTLERAYGADTDAFIPSLRDYWAMRKNIGVEAIKRWKRLSKINRDYRLGGAVSRVQPRHPRLPEHYPQVT